jgi:hypothetical protein
MLGAETSRLVDLINAKSSADTWPEEPINFQTPTDFGLRLHAAMRQSPPRPVSPKERFSHPVRRTLNGRADNCTL